MLTIFIFLYGLIIGSFLNVIIDRIPKGQSIVYPPSHCEHCRHRLAWYDLIPVLSFLMLKGRCRYCQKSIGIYYPFIELLTGLLFVLTYIFSINTNIIYIFYLLIMLSVFIVIFFTDYKYGIIPFSVTALGGITAFFYLITSFPLPVILIHFLSAIGAFLFFLFLFLITKGKGMGFGDVVLVLLMGLFLGFPEIIIALYLAFVLGAIISLILIVLGHKKIRHDTIPFGPFLVAGTFITLFWGKYFLNFITPYFGVR